PAPANDHRKSAIQTRRRQGSSTRLAVNSPADVGPRRRTQRWPGELAKAKIEAMSGGHCRTLAGAQRPVRPTVPSRNDTAPSAVSRPALPQAAAEPTPEARHTPAILPPTTRLPKHAP